MQVFNIHDATGGITGIFPSLPNINHAFNKERLEQISPQRKGIGLCAVQQPAVRTHCLRVMSAFSHPQTKRTPDHMSVSGRSLPPCETGRKGEGENESRMERA